MEKEYAINIANDGINEKRNSYRQIMKATSLFGGVQIFNIIIQIVRSKLIAVILGPLGMGIMGLLTNTISIIATLSNAGINTSAVKNIAEANAANDKHTLARIITIFYRLAFIMGLIGAFITLIISPWLSQITFGNKNYTSAFIWISFTLMLSQLSGAQLGVLQGLRKLKDLAKANLWGSFLGLIITIPLYYIWGIDGIVPGIIGTAIIALIVSWRYAGKIKIERLKIDRQLSISESKSMLKMGFMISLSGLLMVLSSYIIRIFISRYGSIEEVGLYNAGFTIINTYVGMIFTAMATDYYPRLSSVADNKNESRQIINHQAEIAILILAPILVIFLTFINNAITILYSSQFIGINVMLYWACLGMFFKAASWSIAFIFLAKGSSRLFFWNELAGNIYMLSLNILGYYLWGLTGLGISFAVSYLIYFVQVYFVSNKHYSFTLKKEFVNLFLVQFIITLCCFLSIIFVPQPYSYLVGIILIAISTYYSFYEMNKRIDINYVIQKIKTRGSQNTR